MSAYRHLHNLDFIVRELLQNFDCAALVDNNNHVLGLKYESIADIGTLGASAQTVIKYISLSEGDLILLNDPYSGGTTLSSMTFVTPLLFSDAENDITMASTDVHTNANSAVLYLVSRIYFQPQLFLSSKIEEEGLRIPPTPLVHHRRINRDILQALLQHPLCPRDFEHKLLAHNQMLWRKVDQLREIVKHHPTIFNEQNIQKYFDNTHKAISKCFSDWSHGESKSEYHLDSGEFIKLRIYFDADQILFDFSGSSVSKQVGCTDSATLGACVGATLALLRSSLPLNSGLLKHFHVVTPLGSMVNVKYPTPTFRGMTDGVSLIANTALLGLSKIIASDQISSSAAAPVMLSFKFASGVKFFDSLPGGVGATQYGPGSNALQFWTRNHLRNSVQEIESLYPLRISGISFRPHSGGNGQFRGGNGIIKEYHLLESAQLTWIIEQKETPPQGAAGGNAGEPTAIIIYKCSEGSHPMKLEPCEGTLPLEANDRIVVQTAGGGGYGQPKV